MRAFVTGSRLYGWPGKDSDLDVVILGDQHLIDVLVSFADKAHGSYSHGSASVRFGMLNLIVLSDVEEFDRWLAATDKLCEVGPVTKKQAHEFFNGYVDQYNDDQPLPTSAGQFEQIWE